ncbi:MAG TPA: beta-glucosidase BglX [Solirubrobacteraceae bacterium]|jgi:beta-glucosidase|nr:beta-glucosidase BglX [Solirubrobacteraceae bacterium]
MRHKRRRAAIGAVVVALTTGVAGGVVAGTRSSDEAALRPARQAADRGIERRVERLLGKMTLEEKLQQIALLPDFRVAGEEGEAEVRRGLGSVLSLTDPERIRELQRIAVEESRLGIPLLFAFDTIHGYRTVFPIPLGTGASFDPRVAAADARFGARESAAVGLKQTYAPMIDVSHEPRWGRISEAAGEDPYVNSVMGAARVKGTQGGDYSRRNKLIASPKHFAAYGEPEAGRDYATTDMSVQRLWNFYLTPFKAAIDAGADTVMCSFNSINGVPGCGNGYLMNRILKGQWDFDGFVESDWTAVAELRACPPRNPDTGECGHGVAADGPDAARLALNSGVDSEMTSTLIRDHGEQLLAEGRISMRRIDDAVRRILRVKFRAGLFENPYSQFQPEETEAQMLRPDAVAAARRAAGRSMVLLRNEGGVLPLDPAKNTAVIGPLADNQHDMLGPWWGRGDDNDVVTVRAGIDEQNTGTTTHAQGCQLSRLEVPDWNGDGCGAEADFTEAVNVARAADQVVLALGETREMSGEANARSEIDLPGRQEELLRAIKATGKPVAVVLFSGRPLALENIMGDAPAILQAWFPGVQAGPAVADVVFGKVNPGGKLPVSFPYRVGQVPIYYNHEPAGRPCNKGVKWNSQHRDIPSCDPLFVFGHGLSYTTFEVSNLRLSASRVSRNGSLRASVDVANTGGRKGDEVVQLYINDPVARLSQPVRRLRGFERVTLDPGQKRTVTFKLDKSDFGFYDNRGKFVVESGRIDVYAGNSSKAELKQSFTVTR